MVRAPRWGHLVTDWSTDMAIADIKNYFGYTSTADFMADWKRLSDQDKEHLRSGIESGNFTY